MCTRITSEMHISHGVVCYKVVKLPYRSSFKDKLLHKLHLKKKYLTCFNNSIVEIGKEYVAFPTLTKQNIEIITKIDSEVGSGFIHSFKNKEDAIRFAKHLKTFNNVAVIECIIPDEIPYFEGIWSDLLYLSYISTNIKYVKRVY